MAVHVSDENTILAGGVSGGLWRTTDQGTTWAKTTAPTDLQSITCIAQDPRTGETDTWYYGTGEWSGNSAGASGAPFRGDGLFKSTDNGLTWSRLAATSTQTPESFDQFFDYNHELIVNPSNGDVLVANSGGIYRSQDGGTSFSNLLNFGSGTGWADVATTSTGILYAALENDGIYRSTDDGDNWTNVTPGTFPTASGDRIELAIAPSNEDILYMIAENGSAHTLWTTINEGSSWTDLTSQIPMLGGSVGDFTSQGGYDLMVKIKPDDPDFVVIGGTNLYRSTDGFTTTNNTDWVGGYSPLNNISLYLNQHPDQHGFLFLSGDKALSGNDGGVQITNDIGDVTANGDGETVDWIWLNNGYLTTQVYALSAGPGDQIMAGFQDNSTWLTTSSDGSADWTDEFSGDGAYNAFNADGTDRYMSAQNAFIFRVTYSDANSATATGFTQIDPSSGYSTQLFITPFYLDPQNDELFYLGGDNDLFVNTQASSATRSTGWSSIDLGGSGTSVVSEFGLTNANIVYVGTDEGELFRVSDPGGATPGVTDVTGSNFPSGANVSSIGVNPTDENELVVTFSNYGIPSIFYSDNGGTSWTDIGGNLEENTDGSGSGPSVRATRIVGNGLEYLVGTSTGLYSTRLIDGSNTTWVEEGASNIGNVVINHMIVKDDGTAIVGTHGNGVYSATIGATTDLEATSIDAPGSMGFTAPAEITATVTNTGSEDITSFDISLTINSTPVVTDNVVQTIQPTETYEHTFSTTFDFTTPGNYDIEVSVSVAGDQVTGNDVVNSAITSQAIPSDIMLSNNFIEELQSAGTTIGALATTDADGSVHTYSLVEGTGDDDNADFAISASELRSATEFDFETKAMYTIRIQTEDVDGNTYAESFSIEVTDVTAIKDLDEVGITMYPNPFKSRMNLEMVNEYIGRIEMQVLSIDGKTVLLENSYNKRDNRTQSLLDLSSLSSGTYLIQFDMGGKIYSGKLIKE